MLRQDMTFSKCWSSSPACASEVVDFAEAMSALSADGALEVVRVWYHCQYQCRPKYRKGRRLSTIVLDTTKNIRCTVVVQ